MATKLAGRQIRWDDETRELILIVRQQLEEEGLHRPTIRSVLYRLMSLPDWTKKHYTTLCRKLGQWRDQGLVDWGLFSDSGGGSFYRPLLPQEIRERIAELEGLMPASLMADGYLHTVFVEHEDLVDNISRWLDWRVPVVSSKGQLRRENLRSAVAGWYKVVANLKAEGVKCWAIVDWDEAGQQIFNAHSKWLKRLWGLTPEKFAITSEQVREAGLPVHEDHQMDGVIASYGPQRFRQDLRERVGLE